jgi:hypothetical protein
VPGRPEVQQLLVEAADPACPVDPVHLENPAAHPAGVVVAAHRVVTAGRDVRLDLVPGDVLVRELAG